MKTDRPHLTPRQLAILGTTTFVAMGIGACTQPSRPEASTVPQLPNNPVSNTAAPDNRPALPPEVVEIDPKDEVISPTDPTLSLVIRDLNGDHNPDLYLRDTKTLEEQLLVDGAYSPEWSSDGKYVGYIVQRNGTYGAGIIDPNDRARRIENFASPGIDIQWTADNKTLQVSAGPSEHREKYA